MPSYKNEQTFRQVQEGIVFDAGVTKAVNTILVEATIVVSDDTGLEVGDVITGGDTGVTARILRKYGTHIDLIDLVPDLVDPVHPNFEVGEEVTGSISTDTATIDSAALKLTRTVETPWFNPSAYYAAHTLTVIAPGDAIAYLDIDKCKAIKVSAPTGGGNAATVYLESKRNTPALVTAMAVGADPITQEVDKDVSQVIVTMAAAGSIVIEEFESLEAAEYTIASANVESVAKRAESLGRKAGSRAALDPEGASYAKVARSIGVRGQSVARKAESQGALDNSLADLGIAGASIARLAESQGTLDNSIADRGQSLGRRAQSVALKAESQGALDNSLADIGVVGASNAVIAASKAKKALSLARA